MNKFIWNDENYQVLVMLRHIPEWNDKFIDASGNGHKIKILWNSLAKSLSPELNGQEAKDKYNYLLKMFRQYDAQSKISGNGAVQWKHYYTLKEYFKNDPSVTPTITIDSAIPSTLNEMASDSLHDDSFSLNSKILTFTDKNNSIISTKEEKDNIFENKKQKRNQDNKEISRILLSEFKIANSSKNEYYKSLQEYHKEKIEILKKDNDYEKRLKNLENDFNDIKFILNEIKEDNKQLKNLLQKYFEKNDK